MTVHDAAQMITNIEQLDRRIDHGILTVLRRNRLRAVTVKEVKMLLKLEEIEEYLSSEISEQNGGVNVAYNLRQMLEHGLLTKRDHERDGRLVYYKMSPEGVAVRNLVLQELDRLGERLDSAARDLAATDRIGINVILCKLVDALK